MAFKQGSGVARLEFQEGPSGGQARQGDQGSWQWKTSLVLTAYLYVQLGAVSLAGDRPGDAGQYVAGQYVGQPRVAEGKVGSIHKPQALGKHCLLSK